MTLFFTSLTYSFLFIAVYIQVFLMATLFENRDALKKKVSSTNINAYPEITVMVPIFNEQKTVGKTIQSILGLDYPTDKLRIMIIDDGSTDDTWNIVQKFKDHPQISLHSKQNGGKYTALNFGIANSTSEFIGCLDADSFVDPQALVHIMPNFKNPKVMAVTPSLKIQNPDCILALVQNAEYSMGIFLRKMFGFLDAQYVTPGPFSIFRRKVFKNLGLYRHAHNTEDLEMAFRMQKHHYKIVNAHRAVVYTVAPRTLYKLYRQRVRWTGGFMQNAIDYREMILNPKYGNLGMFVLPAAFTAMASTIFLLSYSAYKLIAGAIDMILRLNLIGWHVKLSSVWSGLSTDWWYYNIQPMSLFAVLMASLLTFSILYGKKLANTGDRRIIDILCYLCIYSFIAPFWLLTSVYNTIRSRDAAWR